MPKGLCPTWEGKKGGVVSPFLQKGGKGALSLTGLLLRNNYWHQPPQQNAVIPIF